MQFGLKIVMEVIDSLNSIYRGSWTNKNPITSGKIIIIWTVFR